MFSICSSVVFILLVYSKTAVCSTPNPNVSVVSGLLQCANSFIQQVLDALSKPQNHIHPGPIDCKEVQNAGNKNSGIYRIWPLNWKTVGSFLVYCDMKTDGGGWTVLQRRGNYENPKDFFFKEWKDYSLGFGDLNKEFWLGNERIFTLTNQGNYSLRINLKDKEGNYRYALYKEFWIENENYQYLLHLSGYSGDAGDSFSNLSGMKFTTKDRDNDIWSKNCAQEFKGAWWYSNCHSSNLNGLNLNGNHSSYADGIEWASWKGQYYSMSEVEMEIKSV